VTNVKFVADGVELPLSDAFQLVDAAVLERDLRACDEILDGARDQTSPGCASAATRAPIGTAIPLGFFPISSLPGVKTGTDLQSERARILYQCARTLDRPSRAVDNREKAIARCVDFLAVELSQPSANESVMSLEKSAPRRVPELS
jgi:hypothetical protein